MSRIYVVYISFAVACLRHVRLRHNTNPHRWRRTIRSGFPRGSCRRARLISLVQRTSRLPEKCWKSISRLGAGSNELCPQSEYQQVKWLFKVFRVYLLGSVCSTKACSAFFYFIFSLILSVSIFLLLMFSLLSLFPYPFLLPFLFFYSDLFLLIFSHILLSWCQISWKRCIFCLFFRM